MAIFHFSTKTVSRSAGRSATAAAAYRAGEKIKDDLTGELHDYSRKAGVVSSHILLPDGAPGWAADRSKLWNAAEKAETRKNSCVAREFQVALTGRTPEERKQQALEFAQKVVDKHGCAVDVCIHEPSRDGDQRNYHAHILLTTRRLGPEGFTVKTRELDAKATRGELITGHRKTWADGVNELEEKHGSSERVSHLSNAAQGKTEEPGIHLGATATHYERRTGEKSEKRLNHEAAAAAQSRLQSAKDEGELERLDQEIIDLSGDIEAAKEKKEFLEEIIGVDPDDDTTTTSRGEQMSKTQEPEREEIERGIRADEEKMREHLKSNRDIEATRKAWADQEAERKRQEAEREKLERREAAEKSEDAKRAERKAADQEAAKPITPQEREAWKAEDQERKGDIPPESAAAKKAREWSEEVRARVNSVGREARKADEVIVGKMDELKAERKAHRAEEPEPPRGVFAPFKQAGFEREYAAWQTTDQTLDKQVRGLEQEHDQLEKIGRNYDAATVQGVMSDMEKETPGRTEEVKQAREIEAEEREETKEQPQAEQEQEIERVPKTPAQVLEEGRERQAQEIEAEEDRSKGYDFDPF